MGGEKLRVPLKAACAMGSPPHGRGKAALSFGPAVDVGITPAWAGKSVQPNQWLVTTQDHPRVGGEKTLPRSIP